MMHCKHAVFDGLWSLVGSANMDVRSQELNLENVLGIADTEFAAQVEATFLTDLERASEIKHHAALRGRIESRLCLTECGLC
jgi:cardiolipin synthase